MRRIALLLVVVVIAGGIAAVSTATAQSELGTKLARIAMPEYWYGYWPGNPELCVLDQTDGLPVAEAVADFERTVFDLEIRDVCGETETIIIYPSGDVPASAHDADASVMGEDGMLLAGVSWISVDVDHRLSREHWRILLIHELGHAVGLDHTNRRDSVMNPSGLIYDLDGLTETDVAVLARLYSGAFAPAT